MNPFIWKSRKGKTMAADDLTDAGTDAGIDF